MNEEEARELSYNLAHEIVKKASNGESYSEEVQILSALAKLSKSAKEVLDWFVKELKKPK